MTVSNKTPSKNKTSTCPEAKNHGAANHCWVIEVADGPVSLGECSYCHAKREFYNSLTFKFNHAKNNVPMQWGVKRG
jgi:hypothetical protein